MHHHGLYAMQGCTVLVHCALDTQGHTPSACAKLPHLTLACCCSGWCCVSESKGHPKGFSPYAICNAGQITDKSDMYAFGVMVLEMMTGMQAVDARRPEGCETLPQLLQPALQAVQCMQVIALSHHHSGSPATQVKSNIASHPILCMSMESQLCHSLHPMQHMQHDEHYYKVLYRILYACCISCLPPAGVMLSLACTPCDFPRLHCRPTYTKQPRRTA